jgi:DNA-binding GntR family transcriptional regulator
MVGTLNHKPLREIVADEIRAMIVSGVIAPGQRLIEEPLAEQLGVSRNPVREAIRSLEATGLVEVIPRRGAYAVHLNSRDIRQIQDLRRVIDAWVVQQAALRHTAADLERIDNCIRVGKRASRAGDSVRAGEMHREFHLAIEAATGNQYATLAIEPLRQRTEVVFSVLAEHRGVRSWDEHQRIRDAIASRDPELARKLMEEHIEAAFESFEKARTPTAEIKR